MALQAVELLYNSAPEMDAEALAERISELTGGQTDAAAQDSSTMFIHTAHIVDYDDASMPAQTVIMRTNQTPLPEHYEEDLQQSHATPNASELISGAQSVVMVMEMMARGLPPQERVSIFHATLQAIIEATHPVALAFKSSQQIIAPAAYLDACKEAPFLRPGALNVRFFNAGEDGLLMDTRGLDEIGLHDLQCHFQGLDPNGVAGILYNLGYYLFEHGPVIEGGHTIGGLEEGSKWACQFETALAGPEREVLDINPGAPHAAGNRDEAAT